MKKEENVCAAGQDSAPNTAEAEEKRESALPGKFRDVNALVEAYSALEAEFTRRSQKLKELEKRTENSEGESLPSAQAEKPRGNGGESFAGNRRLENAFAEKQTVQSDALHAAASEPVPPSIAPPAENGLSAARDTAEPLLRREETSGDISEDALYEAARRCEKVRLKIIGDYLSSLKGADAPLMRGGTGTLAAPPVRAKSISEAGNMALRYFKKDTQA